MDHQQRWTQTSAVAVFEAAVAQASTLLVITGVCTGFKPQPNTVATLKTVFREAVTVRFNSYSEEAGWEGAILDGDHKGRRFHKGRLRIDGDISNDTGLVHGVLALTELSLADVGYSA